MDGCIQAAGDGSDLSGYIVTKNSSENFILDWDWKSSRAATWHVTMVENPISRFPTSLDPNIS